jgi:hypothetical protein
MFEKVRGRLKWFNLSRAGVPLAEPLHNIPLKRMFEKVEGRLKWF